MSRSSKSESVILSSVGKFTNLYSALLSAWNGAGGTEQELLALAEKPGELQKMVAAVRAKKRIFIDVDYSKPLPTSEELMADAGGFDYVVILYEGVAWPYLNPDEPRVSGRKEVLLKHFATTEAAIEYCRENGWKLADLETGLALDEALPQLKKENHLILGGSVIRPGGHPFLPILGCSGGKCYFAYFWFGDDWSSSHLFVLVREAS